eukprot:scaffold1049_cov152-Skeletonema_menzelii.AAC.34
MSRLARPPYIDTTTGIAYDTDKAEFEGYLTKQSMWLRDWRRRYFILKGSRLFFAKTPYEAPHGMIDLSRCTTVRTCIDTALLSSEIAAIPINLYDPN